MTDNEPKENTIARAKQRVGVRIAHGLLALSLAKNPQPSNGMYDNLSSNTDDFRPKVTLFDDASHRRVLSPEQQTNYGQGIYDLIKNEFPDQYQNLEAKGKDAQIKALAQSLGSESHDMNEAKIFGRMAGKFLEKNFLNFNEAADTSSITPEMVRVQRMLLERYKEKVPLYGFPDLATSAQNPNLSQQLYAFQDVFTVLRTFRNEFDPATKNLPDKGEELHTINAIDIIGYLSLGSSELNTEISSSYALIYATMAAEGIGDIAKTGLDINVLQFKTRLFLLSVDRDLSYVDRSLSAIKIAKIGAVFLKNFPTLLEDNSDFASIELFRSEIRSILRETKSPSEVYAKAEAAAKEYAHFSTPDFTNLRHSQNQIPSEIRDKIPSMPIDFTRVSEILEARSITNPQERLKKIISILSVVTSDKTPHPRYEYQVEGEAIAACNIYSTDLLQAILGEDVISHRVDANGKPVGSGGQELNAEGMYQWVKEHGTEYGWQDVTSLSYIEKEELLAAGFIFFGATSGHNWVIGMVDNKPILSQATYDIDFMYASPNNYKINGADGVIYAHRIPDIIH